MKRLFVRFAEWAAWKPEPVMFEDATDRQMRRTMWALGITWVVVVGVLMVLAMTGLRMGN